MYITVDAHQAGIIGDFVNSNLGVMVGETHFVTPRRNLLGADIYRAIHRIRSQLSAWFPPGPTPQQLFANDVTLVSSSSTGFPASYEWVNASPVPGSPHKATVSRARPGHFEVKIRNRTNGAIEAIFNVWVVWADITATAAASLTRDHGAYMRVKEGYRFRHEIQPATIITRADRPDLSGANSTAVPPIGGTSISGRNFSSGADHKWDSTRVVKKKTLNPNSVPLSGDPRYHRTYPSYPSVLNGDGRPAGVEGINFRDWRVVGNDDASTGDEDNNPYDAAGGQGNLRGVDRPSRTIRHTVGADGDTVEWRMHFQEFTRLEINSRWYLISERFPWRSHIKMRKVSGKWRDNGSNKALDNAGF